MLLTFGNVTLVGSMYVILWTSCTVACCLLLCIWFLQAKHVPTVPKPKSSLPIVGDLITAIRNNHRLHAWFEEVTQDLGNVTWSMSVPFHQYLVVFTPENVEYVLKTNFDNYVKGAGFNELYGVFLGDGIFTSDGKAWRTQRKITSHMFSHRSLRDKMATGMRHYALKAITFLDSHFGEELDLQQLFFRITFDVICDIAFGADTDTVLNPKLGNDENGVPTGFQLAADFDRTNVIVVERMQTPWWKINRFLGIRKEGEFKHCIKRMDRFVDSILDAELAPGAEAKGDLLSLFRAKEPDADRAYLRDVVMNMIIAGRDTTGWTLTIFFYLLSQHPRVEQKILEELDEVLGDEEPTMELLAQTEYLKAAIFEALRMYPSLPGNVKYAVEKDVLPDGTPVPAGCGMIFSTYIQGRQKQVWGEDANEYRPERFLGEKFSDFKFIAFHAGPRLCLGKDMAILEVRMVTAKLLRRYNFKLSPGHSMATDPSATFSFTHGMKMTFERRVKPSA